jgi:hypothetical protein
VLLGIVLAVLVSPWFMALSAFVGAGLIIAGITGFCRDGQSAHAHALETVAEVLRSPGAPHGRGVPQPIPRHDALDPETTCRAAQAAPPAQPAGVKVA